MSEGIHDADLDEWSVRVSFAAEPPSIDAWIGDAFGEAHGLPETQDRAQISQRFEPDEVHQGARYLSGSNPSDPSATYTVLISPEGSSVVVAAARTSR